MNYTSLHRLATFGLTAFIAVSFFACAKPAPFVWATDYRAPQILPAEERQVRPGDKVIVHVRGQDALSGEFTVAGDGRYRQPRLGLVEVGGYSVKEAESRLKQRLEGWLDSSLIEVSVEHQPQSISVLGSVRRPGRYALASGMGVLSTLAEAGGLDDFADRDGIYVLRGTGQATRIRFRYRDLADGAHAGFELRDGDVIVVE